jgi:hypothetical protein
MMKPTNHHFSGPVSIASPTNVVPKKWYCTLAYNADNKHLGIAVVGSKDQFCRKTGARIALGRTMYPGMTMGQFSYKINNDEELKEVLKAFRKAKYRTQLLDLIYQYFPAFQTHKTVDKDIRRFRQSGSAG